ncbi:NUDIX hydrolase [Ferroacidibacillus organovorans]|uniref:ADP-ribose pyrophosphatase n=1 Tax=Ferroacidibacillus organovorans TaxID=1765683 RepID=A0A162UH55_9BACL|nr:NUDIX domain-containing protein [Ferroacidibacillus organovorans]KYP81754.1 ADP-ribose pyrophosphatase [Ferroacidibacillus organovorans]OAG93731.1 ADP-ribose pyrophosphatase [Ferroacidibacillus organovorans]OPG16076.1 ADP-ribose pyrophosphatase [Ferroacidibacillus organovorans]
MSDLPKHYVSAAVVVMNEQSEMLLIKGPRRGWEPPGGVVEMGESIRDAAVREVKEESGFDIEITSFCGIYQHLTNGVVNTLWLGKLIGGTPQTSDESLAVGFFPVDRALGMVTWSNFRERIEQTLEKRAHPFFVAY